MTEPRTAAGRDALRDWMAAPYAFAVRPAILAIEAEARAAAGPPSDALRAHFSEGYLEGRKDGRAAALDDARAAVLNLHRRLATAHRPGFAEQGNCRTCEALDAIDALPDL